MNRRELLYLSLAGAAGAILKPNFLRAAVGAAGNNTDQDIFNKIIAKADHLAALPIGEAMVEIGKTFLGTSYVGNTLDQNTEEQCVVTFTGLDCVTFFEVSLDMARIIKQKKNTYQDLIDAVTYTRYREGKLTDFTSRLHYTSDWIHDNVKKKTVESLTRELGGVPFDKKIDFMSTHPQSYRQLREHPEYVPVIKKFEEEISRRATYYIPKKDIHSIESKLHSGDILAFTTSVPGLDCSHTGMVLREDGKSKLLHASSAKQKVVISDGTISEYLEGITKDTGMMVVRPREV
ncbi:MAG TPA: N-acetylmuramoyl-L-alanine amidase-like domain-containing protein [Candidatus Kapabacteria bacterium]|nr:N-acetylmuramoyl-L-alanine amidase-like domain-containing protein [Candidatus Kapabacteria bacterium]